MNKGLKVTLLAVAAAFAGIPSSYAAAPVISGLPDIQVGDQEQNILTDANLFIYTGAFRFDDHVEDADSTVSELRWSFDELDIEAGAPGQNTDPWYTVNGKSALHEGSTASALGENDHLNPPSANELRQPANSGQEYADFRDIVFSPGNTPGPFPTPAVSHAMGRVLAFYVSDTTNVTSDTIIVKSVDNQFDDKSGAVYIPLVSNPSFPSTTGWVVQAEDLPEADSQHNVTAGTLEVLVQQSASKGRFAGWVELNSGDESSVDHLKYSEVGTGNVVRAKFHIYAQTLAGGVPPTKVEIPNFNVRINDRFGYCNNLYVQHSLPASDNAQAIADDLAPSTNPAQPSVYRVDIDPFDLPYYSTAAGQNEGLQRYFQAFSNPGEAQFGKLALKESSIGIYERPALSDTSKIIKKYETTADFASNRVQWQLRKLTRGTLLDQNQALMTGIVSTTPVNPVSGYSAVSQSEQWVDMNPGGQAGTQLYTSGVPDTHIGIAALDWLIGAAEDDNASLRARVEPGKLYAIRFYASSTGDSSNNAMIRFRARSVKFSWTHRMEVGGAWNLLQASSGQNRTQQTQIDRASHVVARQALPGNGGLTGSNAAPGAAYDVLMVSPMMDDLRADVAGNTAAKFPQLSAQDGPGQGPTNDPLHSSRRDLFPAADVMDTLSGDYWAAGSSDAGEKGHVRIHKIEIRAFDIAVD